MTASAATCATSAIARWTWDRLVNRIDVWGGYYAKSGKICQATRPSMKQRGGVKLNEDIILHHYNARNVSDIVGLHTTSLDNLSRWGAVDIDRHGDNGPSANVTERAARAWHDQLKLIGFHPLLTTSNGAGGFHLRLILDRPAPTQDVHRFLGWLVSDFQRFGLTAAPEIFPKQPRLDPKPDGRGRYGNWLRLPGKHHKRDHWSRAWGGTEWLSQDRTINFIVAIGGDDPSLLDLEGVE